MTSHQRSVVELRQRAATAATVITTLPAPNGIIRRPIRWECNANHAWNSLGARAFQKLTRATPITSIPPVSRPSTRQASIVSPLLNRMLRFPGRRRLVLDRAIAKGSPDIQRLLPKSDCRVVVASGQALCRLGWPAEACWPAGQRHAGSALGNDFAASAPGRPLRRFNVFQRDPLKYLCLCRIAVDRLSQRLHRQFARDSQSQLADHLPRVRRH